MASGYRHNPQGPEFLAKEIRDIKARLAQLQHAITGLGIQIDPTTNSLVVSSALGRSVRVVDAADGHDVAVIGSLPVQYNRSDGSRQPGVMFNREDGTLAAFLGDSDATTPPYKQAWQVYDRQGNVVMADDTNSGKGLARPWVNGGCILGDTNTARWPSTVSGSFVDIAFTWWQIQNPRLQWMIQHVADAATAGELRLLVDGVQVGTTQTIGTSFTLWQQLGATIPNNHTVDDVVAVQLQARRTSGTGNVYAQALQFCGDQSP